MSLLPYIVNELINDRYDPVERLYDQHFGVGLRDSDLYRRPTSVAGLTGPILSGYLRPFRHLVPEESGVSSIQDDKDQFKISLDVQQFKPEEIKVKVVDDSVIVEGKHEERQDKHGYISRQFTRRYKLPPNTNLEAIKSHLSSDGVLSIAAPKKAIEGAKDREIPIMHTNKPAIKQTSKNEKSAEKMET